MNSNSKEKKTHTHTVVQLETNEESKEEGGKKRKLFPLEQT